MGQNKIQEYINQNSFAGPKRKGKELFQASLLSKEDRDEREDTFLFKVTGTYPNRYDVYIKNATNDEELKTDCNCLYDGGGICKHVIAGLLYIDYFESIPAKKKSKVNGAAPNTQVQKKRMSTAWFSLGKCKELTTGQISAKSGNVRNSFHSLRVSSESKNGNVLETTVVKDDYWTPKMYTVFLELHEGELNTRCTCKTHVDYLCQHQLLVLSNILDFNVFHTYLGSDIEDDYARIANDYGVSIEKAKRIFTPKFLRSKIVFDRTEEAEYLLPVGSDTLTDFSKKMQDVLGIGLSDDQKLKSELLEREEVYGFVIGNQGYREDSIHVSPVRGRLSAKGTMVNLREINYKFDLSNIPSEIIDEVTLISKLNNVHGKQTNQRITELYETLSALISKIRTNQFLFKNTGEGYNLKRSELEEIEFSEEKVRAVLCVNEEEDIVSLSLKLEVAGQKYKIDSRKLTLDYLGLVFIGNIAYEYASPNDLLSLLSFQEHPRYEMSKEHTSDFLERIVLPLAKKMKVDFKGLKSYEVKKHNCAVKQKKLYLSEVDKFIVFKPFVEYENGLEQNVLDQNSLFSLEKNEIKLIERDVELEKSLEDKLRSLHPRFEKQLNNDFFHLAYGEMLEKGWFFDAFEKLQQSEIEVFGLNKLSKFKYSPHKADISMELASGQDWFEVDLQIAFGDNQVSLRDVQKAIRKGENFVKLGDGTLGLLPKEWIEKMERYFRAGQLSKDSLKISKLKFTLVDELFDGIDNEEIVKELVEKRNRLSSFEDIKKVEVPVGIKATLRDYQKEGLNWLTFLNEFKWGGILADDMGLGKTVQILSFLQARASQSKKASLVVIPTTLLFNWQHEIEKFTTDLKILMHYGANRQKDSSHFKDYDIVITTYGMMINDVEFLSKYRFDYVILDESQAIKNAESQRYKAACTLKAANRIAMTGTPIENNTFDLYAQMNFLNPGLLGNPKHFKDNYSMPIDRDRDPERAAELQRIIKPFVLRRTKEQVAKELPPKTEDVIFCEMGTEQRKVYDAFRNKYRDFLLGKIEDDGLGKSKMYVLEGLTKLRQICDSPELLNEEESYGNESIKIDELVRHITDKTGKHKVLIFSQFVKMLNLIRDRLEDKQISFEYLDGQSSQKEREQSVNHFQNDESCRVFLISLKAGGTGLNLTAADYVYLVDPWWNPAVENQAIDRSYRIGQDKKVFAYRMICRDTIEEKILNYQEQKRAVAEDIIVTEESFLKKLSHADIQDLFA